jgi:hypothetical protein
MFVCIFAATYKLFYMLKKLDIFGISASLVCAVHCSVLPIAIAGGLLSNSFLMGHGIFEIIFIVISVFLGVSSLAKSYRFTHKSSLPLTLFTIGLLSVFIGLRIHGIPEIILATFGGLTIAISHLINIKLNKKLKFEDSILA